MTRTPPLRPLSKVPFPRPPARTCALMTMSSPAIDGQQLLAAMRLHGAPISFATASASSADFATDPFGTPIPYYSTIKTMPTICIKPPPSSKGWQKGIHEWIGSAVVFAGQFFELEIASVK